MGLGVEERRLTAVIVARIVTGVLLVIGGAASVRVVREYERGVVFRFGRLRPLRGPSLCRGGPGMGAVGPRRSPRGALTIPPQEVITRDNVPARVNAVVLFRAVDPIKAVMEVENFAVATSQIAQTTLRSLLDREDLDTVLAHRDPEPVMGAIHARPARDRA